MISFSLLLTSCIDLFDESVGQLLHVIAEARLLSSSVILLIFQLRL